MSAAVAPTDPFADGMYSRGPDPRQKMSRSTTAQPGSITPPVAPQKPRRSLSEDQSTQMAQARAGGNGSRSAARTTSKMKEKPSAHADTIDRLDYSGIGGGMFHHDGPFDAAAPSRNKGKPHRAPMHAFNDDGQSGSGGINNVPVVDKRLSPLAQATIAAMVGSDGHGPYPSSATASAYPEDSKNNWIGGPIPQRKNTLAEAWGMHEPEPFEEFSAGAAGRTPTDHLEYGDDGYSGEPRRSNRPAREAPPRRSKLPPPQPIALPGAGTPLGDDPASPTEGGYASSPPAGGYGQRPNVNRKKSLMQRFRKMRDNPNVPYDQKEKEDPNLRSPRHPGVVYEEPLPVGMVSGSTAPPLPSRHKPTGSRSHIRAKSTDARVGPGQEEAFTIIDNDAALAAAMEKALPAPPGSYAVAAPGGNGASAVGYFDYRTPAGGNDQLTRKSSLLNKVKGAVKR